MEQTAEIGTFQPTLPARGATILPLSAAPAPEFQPTLPARGATAHALGGAVQGIDFNPRSPHGERPRGRCGSYLSE